MACLISGLKADVILLAYPTFSNKELAEYLGCSINLIEKFAQFNNLRKARARYNAAEYGLPIDLLGMSFGLLTVTKKMDYKVKNNTVWLCHCTCGRSLRVRSSLLVNKIRTDCGQCNGNPKQMLKRGHPGAWWWSKIKSHARERGIEVIIDVDYIIELFDDQNGRCALSGLEIELPKIRRNKSSGTASLDRIDSCKPYEVGNVQWVHKNVNLAKNKMTDGEFISMCESVAEFQKLKRT